MKTAILLSTSPQTQALFADTLGSAYNVLLMPDSPTKTADHLIAQLDARAKLADAYVVDTLSLGTSSQPVLDWLLKHNGTRPIVVFTSPKFVPLLRLEGRWLIVLDSDLPARARQSVRTYLELHELRSQLEQFRSFAAHRAQPQTAPAMAIETPADALSNAFRYREALKKLSQLLADGQNLSSLTQNFLGFLRELLGVGKAVVCLRPSSGELFGAPAPSRSAQSRLCPVAASFGLPNELAGHLALNLDRGIGRFVAAETRILRRNALPDAFPYAADGEIAREFELLGCEIAVPIGDGANILGVLLFGGKVTGEPLTRDDLELVYHLASQFAHAINRVALMRQVQNQQRMLTDILTHVQSGVIALTESGHIAAVNDRARVLLELGPEEFVGQPSQRLPARITDVLFESLQTQRNIVGRAVRLPRSERELGVTATCFGASPNRVAVAVLDDLSQLKAEEVRAREMQTRQFMAQLAESMSHELKNSLAAIKVFAQLLPEKYGERDFREEFFHVVETEVTRIDVLVNNLTFFARPLTLTCEEFTLSELLEECAQNISQEAERKSGEPLAISLEKSGEEGAEAITLKRQFGHSRAKIHADRLRLKQAVEHVLRNAAQSTAAGGRITLSTGDVAAGALPQLAQGGVRIEVQDTGAGVPLDHLPRVFEPFFTTRDVGVGLGLTIVKKIVETHGGAVELDSMLGKGTRVALYLPWQAAQNPEPESAWPLASLKSSPRIRSGLRRSAET